jgi:hypothetical protein
MSTFHISPLGNEFEVVETPPTGEVVFIGLFQTEADAQRWIDDYIRILARGWSRPAWSEALSGRSDWRVSRAVTASSLHDLVDRRHRHA